MAGDRRGGAGGRLAAWLGRLRGGACDADGKRLARPFVKRHGRYTSLQFSRSQTQSRMLDDDPDALLIDYTRTMMGALVLRPQPRRIGAIGLGGGSQVKFCHRHLPRARIEVVENNPGVVALRRRFGIPDDDARLQVHLDDGAAFVRSRPGRYDVLLVDGYDETGIPPVLSTQRFYDDCRDALTADGAMAVNLFSTDHALHADRLRRSFGDRMLVLEEAKMSNRVAFAWGPAWPDGGLDVAAALHGMPDAACAQLRPVFERLACALAARHGLRGQAARVRE